MGSEEQVLMLDQESRLDEGNDTSEPARQVQLLLCDSIEKIMGWACYSRRNEKIAGSSKGYCGTGVCLMKAERDSVNLVARASTFGVRVRLRATISSMALHWYDMISFHDSILCIRVLVDHWCLGF